MKLFALPFIALMFLGSVIVCADDLDGKTVSDEIMNRLEKSLKTALANVEPPPVFERSESSLTVKYHARYFMVHEIPRAKSVDISESPVKQEGPGRKGFILTAYTLNADMAEQLVRGQTICRPYWDIYLGSTLVKNTNKKIHWNFSYGNQIDHAIAEKVVNAVQAVNGDKQDCCYKVKPNFGFDHGSITFIPSFPDKVKDKLPVVKFTPKHCDVYGGLILVAREQDAVLFLFWGLSGGIVEGEAKSSFEIGKGDASPKAFAVLFRGPNVSDYVKNARNIWPSLPKDDPRYTREVAVGGNISCAPVGVSKTDHQIVKLRFEDLCFPSVRVDMPDAIEAELGHPPPLGQ